MRKVKCIDVFVLVLVTLAFVSFKISATQAASIMLGSISTGSTSSSSARDHVTIPVPSGTASGQVLIAQIAARGGAGLTLSAPSGWSLIRRDNSAGVISQAAYIHVVSSAAEPSSYTWTFNAGNDAAGGIASYLGVNNSQPIDTTGGQNNGVSSVIAAPSINLSHTGERVVALFAIANSSSVTDPSSLNQQWNFRAASYGISVTMSDQIYGSSGTIPAASANALASAANLGAQIALVQQAAGGSPSPSFPKSDAECSAAVDYSSWEPRPDNNAANHRTPTAGQLNTFHASNVNGGVSAAAFDQVDGNFTGTTDEIIQWAACKWGFDPDLVRAIAVDESYWHQSSVGNFTSNMKNCPPGTWNGSGCYQTYGMLQIKYSSFPGTWSMSRDDTAFSIEYKLAYQRACMNGQISYLVGSSGYPSSDTDTMLWGCVGEWYSGGWYDSSAQTYIARIKKYMSEKVWLTW
jgi:hypothetical protein